MPKKYLSIINKNGNNIYIKDVEAQENKADKVSEAVEDNFAGLDANGNLTDSGYNPDSFAPFHHLHSDKADKVSGATLNNLAALNSNGNLKDSGIAASAVAMASDLSDEVDRATAAEGALQALYQASHYPHCDYHPLHGFRRGRWRSVCPQQVFDV